MTEEKITLYTKESPDEGVSCQRSEYYDHAFTTYNDHYPALVDIFLFNAYGDVLLQKRARNKRNNPGRLHTTVGGHISWGEKPEFAVAHECLEELGAPAFVFSQDEYPAALETLSAYTHKVALLCEWGVFFRRYEDDPIESRRDIKDRMWLYFGLYDGPLEVPDRQSAGYEWIDLATLEREFQTHPDQFTDGLKIYIEQFGMDMKEFINKYARRTL